MSLLSWILIAGGALLVLIIVLPEVSALLKRVLHRLGTGK